MNTIFKVYANPFIKALETICDCPVDCREKNRSDNRIIFNIENEVMSIYRFTTLCIINKQITTKQAEQDTTFSIDVPDIANILPILKKHSELEMTIVYDAEEKKIYIGHAPMLTARKVSFPFKMMWGLLSKQHARGQKSFLNIKKLQNALNMFEENADIYLYPNYFKWKGIIQDALVLEDQQNKMTMVIPYKAVKFLYDLLIDYIRCGRFNGKWE